MSLSHSSSTCELERSPDRSEDRSTAVAADPEDTLRSREVARLIALEMPFLRRIVRRWLRDPADAEDLVQETALRALANAHLWEPGTNFRAWAVTIMRNQFFGGFAKSSRHIEAIQELAAELTVTSGDAPFIRLTLRDLEVALARLPTKQRLAVLLVGVEGLSYESAARAMGLSTGAIRCHLARARDRLRGAVLSEGQNSPLASRPPRRSPPQVGRDAMRRRIKGVAAAIG